MKRLARLLLCFIFAPDRFKELIRVWHPFLGAVTAVIREKAYFPSVAYVINTGVYSKCLVKYGYDPRLDIESRKSVPPFALQEIKKEKKEKRDPD